MEDGYSAAFPQRKGVAALLALAAALSGTAVGARTTLGVHGDWAAFRDDEAPRCYAIATPSGVSRGGGGRPHLTVARFPPAAHAELRAQLSRPSRAPVRLRIGGRSIVLRTAGDQAWTAHAAADASIIAAMRGADLLRIEGVDKAGRPFRDVYRLTGAASAVDAAMLGCTGPR